MFSCCDCWSRPCLANRKLDEVFDSETTPLQPHNSLTRPLSVDPYAITSLLYNFLVRELHSKGVRHRSETFYLGSDLDDATYCSLCQKSLVDSGQSHVQFEMNNRFFGNVWLGNLYVLQFVCLSCSKRIQPKLIETLDAVQDAYRHIQALLLVKKLQNVPTHVRGKLAQNILSFLPRSFLSLKTITYHRPKKAFFHKSEEDLSIWVSEQVIR